MILSKSFLMQQAEKRNISERLYRWIAIKLIDGEEKILNSIQENLELNLEEQEIEQAVIEAKQNLEKKDITSKNFKDKIVADIMKKAEETAREVCTFENENYRERDLKIDKILTSKTFGIPIMILFLGIIFWITIVGANYPSEFLFNVFNWFQDKLVYFANYIHSPAWLSDMLINGVYKTLTWIIAVMLPPMAIFFPLFTILEDLGYLPRIAFNMDGFFKKACCSGKQMITMCMGFGCNACGVTGCRIIDSPRERIIAILNKAGYVKSSRGNAGGYKLARKPNEYKVGDILRTAEGDLAPTTCVQEGCHKQDSCLTYSFWQGLDNAIENYVDSKTLEDLIKK